MKFNGICWPCPSLPQGLGQMMAVIQGEDRNTSVQKAKSLCKWCMWISLQQCSCIQHPTLLSGTYITVELDLGPCESLLKPSNVIHCSARTLQGCTCHLSSRSPAICARVSGCLILSAPIWRQISFHNVYIYGVHNTQAFSGQSTTTGDQACSTICGSIANSTSTA